MRRTVKLVAGAALLVLVYQAGMIRGDFLGRRTMVGRR